MTAELSSSTTVSSSPRTSRPSSTTGRRYQTYQHCSSNEDSAAANVSEEGSTSKSGLNVVTRHTYIYALCAALNSVNLGYDLGVSTNAGPLIQDDFGLSDYQLELFLGSLNFWSITGALLSPAITDRYGRTRTFLVAAVQFCIGVTIMSTAKSFWVLMLGRMIVGIGVGVGEAIDPMYIAEVAPTHIRGELVSWAEAGVALGVVLGFSSSFVFDIDQENAWRFMLAAGAAMPMVMMFLILYRVMPESPRWLLSQDREVEARTILETIYREETVDAVVQEVQESLALEREANSAVGWKAILWMPSPAIRRMLTVGVGMAIIQQAVGIDSIMFYLMFVIQEAGIKRQSLQTFALVLLGTVKLIFVFVGAKCFDHYGRRPLLFTSLLGCAGSLVLVSAAIDSQASWSKFVLIGGLAAYLAFFSVGLGPGNWVVVSEVFALSIRAKAMSVAVFPNRVTATIMASTFLTVAKALTWPVFFLVLAGVCLASLLFLYLYLPETAGRSLEEMAVYFAEITGDRSILDVEEKLHYERHKVQEMQLIEEGTVRNTGVLS